jgi:hypothetical protein
MDETQRPTNQQTSTLDGPDALVLTDPEVQELYQTGYIGRPMAEVFNIIAAFNDNEGGVTCSRT